MVLFTYNRRNTQGNTNHKSSKILPKLSSTLHFLQESHKFVQESQIFRICYNVKHFYQDSDNNFAKNGFFLQEILTKIVMCYFDQGPLKNNGTLPLWPYNTLP